MNSTSTWLSDTAWGWPLVLLLIGGGSYLFILSRGLPLTAFVHSLKLIMGKVKFEGEDGADGQLSHFKALTNAIAATVGLGNIGGVAVAITTGGPGAIFWMWVAAFLGMNTKFFECTLAVMFRGRDYRGEVQGGPMYVIEKALGKKFRFLSVAFAIFGLMVCMALYNVNQLAEYIDVQYSIGRVWIGLIAAVFMAYVLMGGVKRIATFTSSLVPTMCVVYVIA